MTKTTCLRCEILVIICLLGSIVARAQTEITLLAPAPARRPIDAIVKQFEVTGSYKVKVTYAPGRVTTQNVAKGEPLDVSLVVAPYPGAITSGTVIPSSATTIASFLVGVGVPKGAPKPNISTPAAVKKALLAAKSIGYQDPDFTSSGQGPTEVIEKLGIADQIVMKSKLCAGTAMYSPISSCFDPAGGGSVLSIQKQLQNGTIDFGMLFLSDMLPLADKITIVGVLPRQICTPTEIVGLISTHAKDQPGAKALLQFLASADSQAIFKEAGLEPHR